MDGDRLIFIVDDQQEVREALEILLESMDYQVEAYGSGEEFLARMKDHRQGCLVIDYTMSGMNGLEVVARLKDRDIDLPVILMTGQIDLRVAADPGSFGITAILEKPFDFSALRKMLADVLGSNSAEPE